MKYTPISYVLGIDAGVASIGWAILEIDKDGNPCSIVKLGVRTFEAAETKKEENGKPVSLNCERRMARSAKRMLRRKKHRKERIKALFAKYGIISKERLEDIFFNSSFDKKSYGENVYALRAKGLKEKLTSEEWARVLYNLAQNRGYKFNSASEDVDNESANEANETPNTTKKVRKTKKADKQQSISAEKIKWKECAKANECLVNSYETVGQMLYEDERFKLRYECNGDIVCNKHGRPILSVHKIGDRIITREKIKEEAHKLFAAQRQFGNAFATKNIENEYCEILLSQRHFSDGPGINKLKGGIVDIKSQFVFDLRGFCTFERNNKKLKANKRKRAFNACFTAEYFKLLQEINNIRIISSKRTQPELSHEERCRIIESCLNKKVSTYSDIRQLLKLNDTDVFNCVRYECDQPDKESKRVTNANKGEENKKFSHLQSYHKILEALKSNYEKQYSTLPEEERERLVTEKLERFQVRFKDKDGKNNTYNHNAETIRVLDKVAEILSLYKDDKKRKEEFAKYSPSRRKNRTLDLQSDEINALLRLSFSGVGSLSLVALSKIIKYMEDGSTYDKACLEVYSTFQQYQATRQKYLSFRELERNGDLDFIANNPVVRRVVSQAIRVINNVIKRYGPPQAINIELARDIKKSYKERKEIEDGQTKNQKKNEDARKNLKEDIFKALNIQREPNGKDILKWRLWKEQREVCLYSGVNGKNEGKQLEYKDVFGDSSCAEIDHIIPYSKSFDDSYSNKVLVFHKENQNKGNRLPLEYLNADHRERVNGFKALVDKYIKDPDKKKKLLLEKLTEEEIRAQKQSHLNDTRSITKNLANILRARLQFASNSPFLNKDSDWPELGAVIPLNGKVTADIRWRLGLEKNREDGDLHHAMDAAVIAVATRSFIKRFNDYWAQKSSEQGWRKKVYFPKPWETFVSDLQEKLGEVFVSRMPNRKVTGAAHEQTIRRYQEFRDKDGNITKTVAVSRTNLCDLRLNRKTQQIDNYYRGNSAEIYDDNEYKDGIYEELVKLLKDNDLYEGGNKTEKGKRAKIAGELFSESHPFYKVIRKKDGTIQRGPRVRKVKTFKEITKYVEVNIQEQEKNRCRGIESPGKAIAKNDNMVRIDVFHIKEGNSREKGYYFVPIYITDTIKKELPHKAVTRSSKGWKEMDDKYFIFSLYPGDLIEISSEDGIDLQKIEHNKKQTTETITTDHGLFYYNNADSRNGTIYFRTHDRKYKGSKGIKSLKLVKKYEVDVLGNYRKVHLPEKRQAFNLKYSQKEQ